MCWKSHHDCPSEAKCKGQMEMIAFTAVEPVTFGNLVCPLPHKSSTSQTKTLENSVVSINTCNCLKYPGYMCVANITS